MGFYANTWTRHRNVTEKVRSPHPRTHDALEYDDAVLITPKTEIRKYLRDADLRNDALNHEFISGTPPSVSALTGLNFVVDRQHNADALCDCPCNRQQTALLWERSTLGKHDARFGWASRS